MKITFGAVLLIAIIVAAFFFFRSKTGKRVKTRATGTATEAIIKDASTPEGAKAYYNEAIDAKKDQYNKANQIYTQMLGKITSYEEQLRALQKENMQLNLNINACIDKGDDEGAKVYLKKQQDAEDKIAVLKDTLKELRSNATAQKEMLDSALQAVNDLKSEKDKAILTLETAQVTKSLQVTPGASDKEEDKMLEVVREGIKKQKEAADGTKAAYKSYNVKSGKLTNCGNFVFPGVDENFFFVIPTNKVVKGDIILVNGKPKCVIEADKTKITVINYEDSTVETILPERHVFMGNTYFYGKIVSMFGSNLGKDKNSANKIFKYMMMSQMMNGAAGTGTGTDSNPMSAMMPFMMMNGGMGDVFDGMFDFGMDNTDTEDSEDDVEEDE